MGVTRVEGKIDLTNWGFAEDVGGKRIARDITKILQDQFKETPQ